jgi:hypothetical protein
VKRPEYLIAAGLIGSVAIGTTSVGILWFAGRKIDPDWPVQAALDRPAWLAAGEVLGAIACVIAAASLSFLGVRHGGSSAFVAFAVLCLALSIPGVVIVTVLDLAYARAAQKGVFDAITFGQSWDWWSAVGWLLFAMLGFLGLVLLGIGLARGNRVLRYPGLALVASLLVMFLFAYAGVLLAASLIWLAVSVGRPSSSLVGPGRDPHPAR